MAPRRPIGAVRRGKTRGIADAALDAVAVSDRMGDAICDRNEVGVAVDAVGGAVERGVGERPMPGSAADIEPGRTVDEPQPAEKIRISLEPDS